VSIKKGKINTKFGSVCKIKSWLSHSYTQQKNDGVVKSPVFVIARSSANAGRRSNPVFSRTYKNEIASPASGGLAMTILPTFYEIIKKSFSS
jgi:hypothetical protein